jgi:hypothetical protein
MASRSRVTWSISDMNMSRDRRELFMGTRASATAATVHYPAAVRTLSTAQIRRGRPFKMPEQ